MTLDRYATEGYDLDPTVFGATTPALRENTADVRGASPWASGRAWRSARAPRRARSTRATASRTPSVRRHPSTRPSAAWTGASTPSSRTASGRLRGVVLSTDLSAYVSRYRLDTDVVDRTTGQNTFDDRFDQSIAKGEGRLTALWSASHRTLVGAGALRDALGGSRYGDPAPRQSTLYGYVQHDWEPSRLVALNVSARLDDQSAVGARLTPKAAVLCARATDCGCASRSARASARRTRASSTSRSPTPPAATSSTARRASPTPSRACTPRAAWARSTSIPAGLGAIRPESSVALNAEVEAEPVRGLRLTLGGFRNAVTDLIDVQPVAQLAAGGPVFSYLNVDRVRTEGVTLDATAAPAAGLSLGAGVQWLRSRDLDVVDAIRAGTVFSRDPDGREARVTLADYANLVGRAALTGTLRTAYATRGWTASLRGRLRSRTALRDLDGNGVATRDDEFVPGDGHLGRDARPRRAPRPRSSQRRAPPARRRQPLRHDAAHPAADARRAPHLRRARPLVLSRGRPPTRRFLSFPPLSR